MPPYSRGMWQTERAHDWFTTETTCVNVISSAGPGVGAAPPVAGAVGSGAELAEPPAPPAPGTVGPVEVGLVVGTVGVGFGAGFDATVEGALGVSGAVELGSPGMSVVGELSLGAVPVGSPGTSTGGFSSGASSPEQDVKGESDRAANDATSSGDGQEKIVRRMGGRIQYRVL